jgi:DNA-binding NarL/FixJ family response regulator
VSKTSIDVRQPAAARVARGTAALIAGGDLRETIIEILERQGVAITVFDRVEDLDLSSGDGQEAPSVIVLWIEDTIASLTRSIEPLAQRFAQTPIVVACSSIQRWEVRAALTAGAAGVVLHDDLDSALAPCLQSVQAGQVCVPRAHWRQIEPPALSAREKQILGLVVMGYMNGQIAEQLFLAESTVKSHLSSAFGKLGVRSRNEAVNLILDPERGLGMGILALVGEPLEPVPGTAQ